MDATVDQFHALITNFDGSDTAAMMIGRWTALARPDIVFTGTADEAEAAQNIEKAYYRVDDGVSPISELVAAIEAARAAP
jgi:hypothetical protein